MLKINNLHVQLEEEDKKILKGVDLTIEAGTVHAIMGPNGSGKSTLSYVLSGKDGYEVTDGSATLDGLDLLDIDPEERAAAGLFLAFQYPVEIPGVGNMTFLRTAVNAQRKARGEEEMKAPEFLKKSRALAAELKMKPEMLKRPLNVGFSGGEKKRMEIFQMMILEPNFIVMDETDSGLDVDALRIVADGVNRELIEALPSDIAHAVEEIDPCYGDGRPLVMSILVSEPVALRFRGRDAIDRALSTAVSRVEHESADVPAHIPTKPKFPSFRLGGL